MSAAAGALRDGAAAIEDVDRLRRWSVVLRGRGACATLDAACNVAASLLDQFPDEVARHLDAGCPDCGSQPFRADRPYQAEAVSQP
jgi:NADH:ubiquinone oxidoreductase subunit F (NADH-binding)